MARQIIHALVALGITVWATPSASQGQLTTRDSASKQPTLPSPMPNLTVPVSGSSGEATQATTTSSKKAGRHMASHHGRHSGTIKVAEPIDRPALANVELTEPLPHPPQPPHVTVPVPAFPFENIVTAFTTPPPPVVCRPTHYNRYQPDYRLVDERPVLCTADNP